MPLVGLIDPSHYERAHDRPGRRPKWYTLEEVLEKSSAASPKWAPWTYELVNAVVGEQQERGKRISTTALTGGDPRAEIIRRHEDYVDTVDSLYLPLRGTMVHRTLERYARPGSIAEAWFLTTIDGIQISCSPDLLTEDTVYDYKVPADISGVPMFGYPFRHQTEQLMLNQYITGHMEEYRMWKDGERIEGVPLPFDPTENRVKHAVIVYIGPKGPKVIEYLRKQELVTPAGKIREVKRPYVWSDEEVLDEFRPKLHIFQSALERYPEWPEPYVDPDTGIVYTAEDRWEKRKDGKYKLIPGVWGGDATYECPGPPLCNLPGCLAARKMLTWEREDDE